LDNELATNLKGTPILLLTYTDENDTDGHQLNSVLFDSPEDLNQYWETLQMTEHKLQLMLPNSVEKLGYTMYDVILIRLYSVFTIDEKTREATQSEIGIEYVTESGEHFLLDGNDAEISVPMKVLYSAANRPGNSVKNEAP